MKLLDRIFCPECGEVRHHNPDSRYAVCMNHGRLVATFTDKELCDVRIAKLPMATKLNARVGRKRKFAIEGHGGFFVIRGNVNRCEFLCDIAKNGGVLAVTQMASGTKPRLFTAIEVKEE